MNRDRTANFDMSGARSRNCRSSPPVLRTRGGDAHDRFAELGVDVIVERNEPLKHALFSSQGRRVGCAMSIGVATTGASAVRDSRDPVGETLWRAMPHPM